MSNKFHFDRVKENLQKLHATLPAILANDAQKFFVDNFRKQGWQDEGLQPWQDPKRKAKGRGRSWNSATLVQSGRLRQAVGNSIRQKTFDKIKLVVDVAYAAYNNEGTEHIPKRQFMGDSKTLRIIQRKKIIQAVDSIWQK